VTEAPATEQLPLLERFKYLVFLVIAAALAVGVAALLWRRPEPATVTVIPPEPTLVPSPTPVPSATPTPGPHAVYVTGAVASPEIVVTLPYGSRVLHAIEAAGGALDNADLERVNLAQVLNDGDQVQVPTSQPGTEETTASVQLVTSTPGTYTVYVTGEVSRPQTMLILPTGSRVEDAIEAAGGTTDNADLTRVNLSQFLNDGDLVYVPPLEGEDIQTPTPNRPPLVHVNGASLEELETLPGIGPALAQAIIDYRIENGPFTGLEDMDNVPGIGPSKLEAIRDLVVFD
jgi:competence protein ComEA